MQIEIWRSELLRSLSLDLLLLQLGLSHQHFKVLRVLLSELHEPLHVHLVLQVRIVHHWLLVEITILRLKLKV